MSNYRNKILNDRSLTKEEKLSKLILVKNVGWCFTLFRDEPPVMTDPMLCLIYQREICPKTQNHHWQCAFRFRNENGNMLKYAQKQVPKDCHIEPALGLWEDQVKYCSKVLNKDGSQARVDPLVEPVILGDAPSFGEELKKRKASCLLDFCEELKKGTPLKKLCLEFPEEFVRNHNGLKVFAAMCIKPDEIPYDLSTFNRPAPILFDKKEQKHWLISGAQFLGKSSWIRACFPKAMYVYKNIEALINWDPSEHDVIIFDDCLFKNDRDRNEQLQLLQSNATQTIRIRFHNIVIPQYFPRIFLHNPGFYPFDDDEAINARLEKLELTEKLY